MKHGRKRDHLVVVYDAAESWVGVGYLSLRKVGDYWYAHWDNDHVVGDSRNEPTADSAVRKAIERAGYVPMTFDEAKAETDKG